MHLLRLLLAAVLATLVLQHARAADPVAAAPGSGAGSIDLVRFFEGRTYGVGTFRPIVGDPVTFRSTFKGVRSGDAVVLTERFDFADGTVGEQVWRLSRGPDGALLVGLSVATGLVRAQDADVPATLRYRGRPPREGPVLSWVHRIVPVEADAGGAVTLASNRVTGSRLGVPVVRSDVTFAKRRADLPDGGGR